MTATGFLIHGPELPAMGIVESLDSQDRALLCSYGQFRFLKSGDELIAQGEEQNALFFCDFRRTPCEALGWRAGDSYGHHQAR